MARGLTVLSALDFAPRRMGSFEEYFCALGRRLRDAGGRCVAAFSGAPADDVAEQFREHGVEWRVLPFRKGLPATARALRSVVREVRPDVTHFHFVPTSSPLFHVARWSGARRIVVSHHYSFPLEDPPRPFLGLLGRCRRALALAPCSLVVTPSAYIKNCLVERHRIPAKRIRVVLNGVNLRRFDPGFRPTFDVRAEYAIPPDAPIVSTLAYFIPEKGAEDLVRAMPSVLGRVPEAHLLLIGDGPEIPRLKAMSEELGLTGNVHFTGLASGERLDSLLAETLVTTLVCTWGEAFSLVVLEFMACGKPMVATAVGGTPEAVEDGKTGLLVPPHSPDRVAEALVKLLLDPDRAREMGRAARRRAEELFDVERMVSDTLAVYRDVSGQANPGLDECRIT